MAKLVASVIGVSEATVSRMKKGDLTLETGSKPFELAVLMVRLFRSLDAIAGGDEKVSRAWMKNENLALGGAPVARRPLEPVLPNVDCGSSSDSSSMLRQAIAEWFAE